MTIRTITSTQSKPKLGSLFAAYYASVFQELRCSYDEKTNQLHREKQLADIQREIDNALDTNDQEMFYSLTNEYIALKEGN